MVSHQIASLIFPVINIIFLFNAASKVKGNEQTLAEEYQNLTLTNKIIEKLLQNYEILKSMYKSQDVLHSSSSFEVNKTYKSPQVAKTTKHRSRSLKKIINYSRTSLRPGTAMIYGSASSHEEVSISVEKTKDEKNIGKNVSQKTVKFENILENNKKQASKVIESKESESNDEIDELPLEMPTTKYAVNKQTQNAVNPKKLLNKKHKSKHNGLGEKTRFDILKQVSHKKQKHKSLRTDNDTNTRRIKKVVYSELFSPYNIWYEVINKPIKLNIDIDPFSQKPKPKAYEKQDEVEKFSVYILNSSTKESREERTESELRNIEIENLLRSTYGEACLRTPITKCKKVVKAVNKNVCKSRFKCKSDFKSDFVEFGDEGCEREFSFRQPDDKNKHDKKSNEDKIQPLIRKRDEAKIEEYLREENNFKELSEKNRHDIIIDKSALRDKYERECQKQSKSKCIKACNYAVEKTCSKHTCEDRKERGLQKGCKTECKKMFQVLKDTDESGSSESESESETASD